MNEKELLVLDIETTGINHRIAKIVEIGIVHLNLNDGVITPIFNEVIKEEGFGKNDANSWIFENSTLLYSDCLLGKSIFKYKNLLNLLFKHYHVTAYNKKFDFTFLRSRGIKIPNEYPDPMVSSTRVLKIPPTDKMINAGFGNRFKTASVQETYRFLFDSEKIEPHRAREDVIMEAEIIKKLYDLNEYKIKKKDN